MQSKWNGRHWRLLITGLPHFARRLGSLIQAPDWHVSVVTPSGCAAGSLRRLEKARLLTRLPFCDLVYQLGGPCVDERIMQFCANKRRPIVLHWVGSDVCELRERPELQSRLMKAGITHWVDAPWLQTELSGLHISSTVMPSSSAQISSISALPSGSLTALLYLPDKRWEFYNGPSLTRLAVDLPSIQFLVLGSDGKDRPQSANIHYLGWVEDPLPVYSRCHVFMRMPIHDGVSAMVIEALSHGRHVIWGHSMPGVTLAPTAEEGRRALLALERQHSAGQLSLNKIGMDYTRLRFSDTVVASQLRAAFLDLLKPVSVAKYTLEMS